MAAPGGAHDLVVRLLKIGLPALIGVLKQQTGTFTASLLFLAGSLALAGIIALLFGYAACDEIQNRKKHRRLVRPLMTIRSLPDDSDVQAVDAI